MRRITVVFVGLLVAVSAFAQEPVPRPPIYGIAYVRIHVTALKTSTTFYKTFLGLIPSKQPCVEDYVSCFWLSAQQVVQIDPLDVGRPENLVKEIGFWTSDVKKMSEFLLSKGIKTGPVMTGVNANPDVGIPDPEGNWVFFVQRPKIDSLVPDSPISAHLIHTGFVVHNRATEDHFYKDILGFRPYWHGGRKDDKDDWVAMQVPDGTDWVEYMLNISPTADKHTLGVMNHIALGVTDIQAAKAQLIKNGWKPGEEPKLGRDGKWQLNLYDPDDTRIEFMEFTPKGKTCCSEFTGPHPGPKQ